MQYTDQKKDKNNMIISADKERIFDKINIHS